MVYNIVLCRLHANYIGGGVAIDLWELYRLYCWDSYPHFFLMTLLDGMRACMGILVPFVLATILAAVTDAAAVSVLFTAVLSPGSAPCLPEFI